MEVDKAFTSRFSEYFFFLCVLKIWFVLFEKDCKVFFFIPVQSFITFKGGTFEGKVGWQKLSEKWRDLRDIYWKKGLSVFLPERFMRNGISVWSVTLIDTELKLGKAGGIFW